jgi:pantothenate synthetase
VTWLEVILRRWAGKTDEEGEIRDMLMSKFRLDAFGSVTTVVTGLFVVRF